VAELGAGHLFPGEADPVPELEAFSGPFDLVTRGLPLPTAPGVYVVASGDCVSHIGTSGNLRSRVRSLAALGTHRGSAEVVCAAHCTQQAPLIWWYPTPSAPQARVLEAALKGRYGEPPTPRDRYGACVNGAKLQTDLVGAAGRDSWEAGFIEAVFLIGEKLNLLFQERFDDIWTRVGAPPGPWRR
jgi:hypothetical protein